MYSFHSSISRDASFTQLSTNSTLLHASKGDAEVRVVAAVDPNHCEILVSSRLGRGAGYNSLPASILLATSCARVMFSVKMAAPRP